MNVVVVGPAYPYRGGIAHFGHALERALSLRGHDVSLVTFSRQYPERLFPGRTQFEDGPPPPGPRAARWIDAVGPWTWHRAARRIAALAPDAVVFQHWLPQMAPAMGTIARSLRRRGIRTLGVVHNALPHEPGRFDAPLARYALRGFDAMTALSDAVAADCRRLAPRRTVLVQPHPTYDFGPAARPDAARDGLGLPADAPVLLFFGFVRRYKGLDILLEALPRVAARLPDVRLVVAGEFYDDPASYRQQIERLGLGPRVVLHDRYIPREGVAAYFAAADLVVQPYRTATQSGVAQIAYHFERPVVVTDVGGLAEVVPDGRAGFVVPPEDPGALAAAVVDFFEDGHAEPMRETVRQIRDRYTWGAFAATVERLAG